MLLLPILSPLLSLTSHICVGLRLRDRQGGGGLRRRKQEGHRTEGSFHLSFHHNNELPISVCPLQAHHAHTYAHAQTHKHTQKPALHMTPNLHDNQLPFIVLHHAGKPVYSLCVKEKESQEKESRRFVCFRVCFCILRATACRLFSSDCVFEGKCLAMFWQSSGAVLDSSFSFTHTFRILWTYCWKTDL